MITVGYGDIIISNTYERFFTIVAMFGGVIFFSLIVGSLTTLISEMDKRGIAFEKKLDTLLEIKKKYSISDYTFNKVHEIIKFGIYRADEDYREFLEELPDGLQEELGYKIYKPVVKGLAFFENTDKDFISKLAPCLKKLSLVKGESVFSEGEYANEMYFLKKGTVGYSSKDSSSILKPFLLIKKGNYFGEIDMIFY